MKAEITVKQAMDVLKQAMIDDNPSEKGSFAHSWHCNIAAMCTDAIYFETKGLIHNCLQSDDVLKISNEAAARFMKCAFDVETKG